MGVEGGGGVGRRVGSEGENFWVFCGNPGRTPPGNFEKTGIALDCISQK